MTPTGWRAAIGPSLFNRLVAVAYANATAPGGIILPASSDLEAEDMADVVAAVLSEATEMGFSAPVVAPRVSDGGTATLWPRGEQVLTTTGLLDYYIRRGHKFFLLRMPQMLRAHRGPLAARLQEALALYEAQCEAEGVEPLPDYADCRLFVGGKKGGTIPDEFLAGLITDKNGE